VTDRFDATFLPSCDRRADGFAVRQQRAQPQLSRPGGAGDVRRSAVAARIYDPRRAEVSKRLGIPTVAPVALDGRPCLRQLLPKAPTALRDATVKVVLTGGRLAPDLIGDPVKMVEASGGDQIVYVAGSARRFVPQPCTVLLKGTWSVIAKES